MVELGWSAPLTRVDARAAQRGILWQHQRIRELLAKARVVADSALDGDTESLSAVAGIIEDLHFTMEAHLSFEERVLLPLLAEDLGEGTQRAARLRDEHRHQRAVLDAIEREAWTQPQLPTLAVKLAFLTSWLLADMQEEEKSFLDGQVVP